MDSLLCPLGKENPYIFSKFNPLNTDTLLIQALSMAPSVSVLNIWSLTVFIYNKRCPIILCCVYCFHRNCKTLCSHVVSVMSVIKKSDNAEGQILNTVWFSLQTWRVYHTLVAAIYINLFFLVKRNFAKNVNCGLSRAAKQEDKVWLGVLKKYFCLCKKSCFIFFFSSAC